MPARLMNLEQAIAHNKRVRGLSRTEPLERVRIGKPAKKQYRNYSREFAEQLRRDQRDAGMCLEYRFDNQLEGGGRNWAFDICWPERRFAVEVEGGAHCVKKQYRSDLEKHQAAFFLGYRVLRVSPKQVDSGEALELVRRALG